MTGFKTLYLYLILVVVNCTENLDCGPGQIRGLEGTCVKKFVIPERKSECSKLDIEHGQVFLVSGRFAQFYCDHGFIRVPDTEVAICQVMGTWSKQVPVCLKPGCQVKHK